jgi:hypothetical protein
VALIGVILLAAALRLWRLPTLPPGLWYDEAINGVDVRMMLAGRGWPLYFTANNGREPLFIYLQALSVALLGYTPYALRLVSALTGILTIPAVYACARAFWPGSEDAPHDKESGRSTDDWPALIAAAGLAVSFWHLSLSRLGLRAIMLPLVSALAMAFFWRAWTHGRRRDYIGAGVGFAAALYTYTAARLLPLVPLAFIGIEALLDVVHAARLPANTRSAALWRLWRPRSRGLAWLIAAAALLTIPLAVAAWQAPDIVLGRAAQVSVFDAAHPDLPGNVLAVARNFYDAGDLDLRHNLPGRPANDVLLAALFTVGWLAALWRIRQPQNRLLLIWFGVMLAPTFLTTEAPHSLRGAGALPPLALLYGLGAQTLLALPQKIKGLAASARAATVGRRYAAPVLLAAVLIVSGGLTARDYFIRWAASPRLWDYFSLPQQLAASATAHQLPASTSDHPLLLPYDLFITPQMVFAIGLPAQSAPPASPTPRFILPADGARNRPIYLLWQEAGGNRSASLEPLSSAAANDALAPMLAHPDGLQEIAAPTAPADWPVLWEGTLPADARLQARQVSVPLDIAFANGLRLTGYHVQPDVVTPTAGSQTTTVPAQVTLTLFWQLDPHYAPADVMTSQAFVQLSDGAQVLQTQNGYLTEDYLLAWGVAGRTLQDIRTLGIAPGAPRGKAYFEVGLYHLPASGAGSAQRVNIVDPRGHAAGDHTELGAIMIGSLPPVAGLTGAHRLDARFDERIALTGWTITSTAEGWNVQLAWQALARSATDYAAFVHLLDAAGQIIAQCDQPPGGPANPTTHWVPGEQVLMTCTLPKAAQSSGTDAPRLRVGLYEPVSGRQLPVSGADVAADSKPGDTFVILSPAQ